MILNGIFKERDKSGKAMVFVTHAIDLTLSSSIKDMPVSTDHDLQTLTNHAARATAAI